MKTFDITVFDSLQTKNKIPISPFESGEFNFKTVETTLKTVFDVLTENFYLSNNFCLNDTIKRRNIALEPYLNKTLTHIVLDIDEVTSENDLNKIYEILKEQDYKFALGKSKSFNGVNKFTLKGVILCKGENNKEAIRTFINELNSLIGQNGHVDSSILSIASYQAPTYNGGMLFYHNGKKVPNLRSKKVKKIEVDVTPESLLDLCLNEFRARGFAQTNVSKTNKNLRIFIHINEKTPKGYFLYDNNPLVMHHHNGKKINIFDSIKKTTIGNKYLVSFIKKKQQQELEPDKPNKSKNSVLCNEEIMEIDDDKNEIIDKFLSEKKSVLKIKAAMGTGKSIIIHDIVKKCKSQKKRILFITNRISVAKDIKMKMDIKIYNEDQYNDGDNLIVQMESLWKYDIKNFDIIILDEFMSLLMHTKNTLSDYHQINKLKFRFVLENKSCVIADAFLFKTSLFFKRGYNIYNKYLEDTCLLEYKKIDDIIEKMVVCSNKSKSRTISISSNNKKMVHLVEYILQERGIRTMLLTAETPESTKELIYKHFARKSHDAWDAIIYTPTLTVGVSNMNDISDHFHLDNGGTIDTISSIQMIKRSRLANNIHYFVHSNFKSLETDLNELNTRTIEKSGADAYTINKVGDIVLSDSGVFENKIESIYNSLESDHENSFKLLLREQFSNKPIIIEATETNLNLPKIKEDVIKKQIEKNLEYVDKLSDTIYDTIAINEMKLKSASNEFEVGLKLVSTISKYLIDMEPDELSSLIKKEIKSDFKYIDCIKNIAIYNLGTRGIRNIRDRLVENGNFDGLKFIDSIELMKMNDVHLYSKFTPNMIKDLSSKLNLPLSLKTMLRRLGYKNKNSSYILNSEMNKDSKFIDINIK